MPDRVHYHPNLIFAVGTQVVTLREIVGQQGRTLHPRGSVGVVVVAPRDPQHSYRIRFPDGVEETFQSTELTPLAKFKEGDIGDHGVTAGHNNLFARVIYRCIVGSQAYGLADSASDIDRRGIYLPPAQLEWSLYGVPEQLECEETQEAYWEIRKFLILALRRTRTCWSVFIRPWWRRPHHWPLNCSLCARPFCRDSCIRRTTDTSCHSSRRCRRTSAIGDR